MKREDDVRAIADAKLAANVEARGLQRLHFFQQRGQIHHHAVADDGQHPRPQDAAGNKLQDELFLANEDGMAGIMAALISRDNVEALGEQIHNFTFALVAPLRAKDDDVAHALYRSSYCNESSRNGGLRDDATARDEHS